MASLQMPGRSQPTRLPKRTIQGHPKLPITKPSVAKGKVATLLRTPPDSGASQAGDQFNVNVNVFNLD